MLRCAFIRAKVKIVVSHDHSNSKFQKGNINIKHGMTTLKTAVDGFHSFNFPIYGRELDVFGCNELCVRNEIQNMGYSNLFKSIRVHF
jgi:hypothetical protein